MFFVFFLAGFKRPA